MCGIVQMKKNKIKSSLINFGLKYISVDDKIVRMFLQTKPSNLKEIVILPATKIVEKRLIKKLEQQKSYGRVTNGVLNGVIVSVIRSLVGCPNTSVTLESLKRCSVKAIVRVDFCGGVSLDDIPISIGDILVPNMTYCGDGTCPQYIMKYPELHDQLNSIPNPNPKIQELKSGNQSVYITEPNKQLKDILINEGTTIIPRRIKEVDFWTTDALFCENELFINSLKSISVQGIDMENSIFFLFSKLFNIKVASILSVSDLPGHPKYDLFNSNTLHPDMETGIENAIKITIASLPKIKSLLITQKNQVP